MLYLHSKREMERCMSSCGSDQGYASGADTPLSWSGQVYGDRRCPDRAISEVQMELSGLY